MASGWSDEFPNIVWRIHNFHLLSSLETGCYKVKHDGFKLRLEMICAKNIADDIYKLLYYNVNSLIRASPLTSPACVYIKDAHGNDHFRQLTPDISKLSPKTPMWSVKRIDLMAKYEQLLLKDGTIEIICTFGPPSVRDERGSDLEQAKGHKAIQTSTYPDSYPCIEKLSQDLQNHLANEVEPDVVLLSGDEKFPAHRSILAARSRVFKAMFSEEMTEKLNGEVNISDIEPDVLRQFLQYVYSGTLSNLSDNSAQNLYAAGSKYVVEPLTRRCVNYMVDNVTDDDALSLVILADAHNDDYFKKRVVTYITRNEQILKQEDYLTFSRAHPGLSNEIYRSCLEKYTSA